MPPQSQNSPLSAFLMALKQEQIDCILIGAMAAIEQGAPFMTIGYDFWVELPERHCVRLLTLARGLGAITRAQTVYELSDGTQVNAVFRPDGLRPFRREFRNSPIRKIEGVPTRILPLVRVIASKRAANRDKDIAVLPVLERTLRLAKSLKGHPTASARKKRKGI